MERSVNSKKREELGTKHVLLVRAGQPAPNFQYQTLECTSLAEAERQLHEVSYFENRALGEPENIFKPKDVKIGLLKAANGEYVWISPIDPPVLIKSLCSGCRGKIRKTYIEKDYKVTA